MIVFDSIANKYDQWYQTKTGKLVDQIETKCVLEFLNPIPGMRILDVGCGTGNFSIKLAKLGCDVIAIDPSSKMIQIAQAKASNLNVDIDFMVGDCAQLSFGDNSFDAVLSVTAIEFFNDVEEVTNDMFNLVCQGGKMVIGTINRDSPWGELYETPYYQENTVFKYASLLDGKDMKSIKNEHLIDFRYCLFLPPDAAEEDLTMDMEDALSVERRGGFITGLWKK